MGHAQVIFCDFVHMYAFPSFVHAGTMIVILTRRRWSVEVGPVNTLLVDGEQMISR